jgi:hypothetical protein
MSDIAALIEAATDTSQASFRRKMAVADLARSKEPRATETLIALLHDEDTYLRREVVSGLAKTEDPAAIEPLIGVLEADDDYLLRDAAEALGRFGDRRAIQPLRKLLEDNSYSVRYAAERSLKQIDERQPPAKDGGRRQVSAPETTTEQVKPESEERAGDRDAALSIEEDHVATATDAERQVDSESPSGQPSSPPSASDAEPNEEDARQDVIQAMAVDDAESTESPGVTDAADVATAVTPLAPVKAFTAVQPVEDVVTAELSTPASDPWPQATERQTPAPPTYAHRGRDWDRARRFRTVFGTVAPELRDLYDALAAAEAGVLESEGKYRLVLDRLGDEQSASREGLTRLEKNLSQAAKELAELEREKKRHRRKQYKLEREASTLSFQIASFMSSERTRRNREEIRKLAAEISRLDAVAEATQARREKLQQQYDALAAPLKQLQQQAEELAETRASRRQAIGDAQEAIDIWMSDQLSRLPTEDLQQRIAELAESSPNATLLAICADELIRAAAEIEKYSVELLEAETTSEQSVAAAGAATDDLGATIAAGFRLASAERRTNVRLSGSLQFREERGTFGGFSGADGTARGSGSGQAVYTVDELQWNASSEFRSRVMAFKDAWTQCGTAAARSELLQVLVAAARRRVEDLTRLIRTEVERDFAAGGRE